MNFKANSVVRCRGKSQEMTVVGRAALATTSVAPRRVASMAGRILCRWVGKNGKIYQRSFDEGDLELISE